MGTNEADRNLLFGLLALQNDFINRDALVGAFGAWVARKGEALGAILIERGDLKASRRVLLEALVDEHIAQHGQDPARSLAALSSIDGAAAQALADLPDPDVRASLVSVVHRSSGADSFATRATAAPPPRTDAHRFEILRFHAKGGLGKVSVALDRELNREVAYKEIQEAHADVDHSRDRFMLEGEVTGGLEHPGIVPVYSLGKEPGTGRPFYAMRFIRGENLERAIERFHVGGGSAPRPSAGPAAGGPAPRPRRRSPGGAGSYNSVAFRDLLGRFLDVCDAIAYAHDRGVLHRDLKPGNIMLGKYGETLVVDWGLARLINADSETPTEEPPLRTTSASSGGTMAGSAIGTPGFMSPEQADGRLDLLGPATDVYALGATLYPLLTGRPAFDDPDREARLEKTRRGEFPTPRQIQTAIPKPLEAICLKAMSLKPQDRYHSVKHLADDLKRWLADEPVTAYREPALARARRWSRRHRTAVTTAASTALLSAVLIGTGWVWYRAREADRQTRLANLVQSALDEANRSAGAARIANGPTAWSEAVAEVQRSSDLVASGGVDPSLSRRVATTRSAILSGREQVQRTARLLIELDEARLRGADINAGKFDLEGRIAAYRSAFQAYGVDVEKTSASEVVQRLGSGGHGVEIASALDDWALREEESIDSSRILAVASLLDPDALRVELRDAVVRKDVATLRRIADEVDVASQSPQTLVRLGSTLRRFKATDLQAIPYPSLAVSCCHV